MSWLNKYNAAMEIARQRPDTPEGKTAAAKAAQIARRCPWVLDGMTKAQAKRHARQEKKRQEREQREAERKAEQERKKAEKKARRETARQQVVSYGSSTKVEYTPQPFRFTGRMKAGRDLPKGWKLSWIRRNGRNEQWAHPPGQIPEDEPYKDDSHPYEPWW